MKLHRKFLVQVSKVFRFPLNGYLFSSGVDFLKNEMDTSLVRSVDQNVPYVRRGICGPCPPPSVWWILFSASGEYTKYGYWMFLYSTYSFCIVYGRFSLASTFSWFSRRSTTRAQIISYPVFSMGILWPLRIFSGSVVYCATCRAILDSFTSYLFKLQGFEETGDI